MRSTASEDLIDKLSKDGVFDVGFIGDTWRAFYRSAWHNANLSWPDGTNYLHADGATAREAVERALVACIAERLQT